LKKLSERLLDSLHEFVLTDNFRTGQLTPEERGFKVVDQIAQTVSMNDPALTVLADSIVGQAVISMRLVDFSGIARAQFS